MKKSSLQIEKKNKWLLIFSIRFACSSAQKKNDTVTRSSSLASDKRWTNRVFRLLHLTLSLQINGWSMQTHAILYRLNDAHRTQVLMPFINSWKLPQTRYDVSVDFSFFHFHSKFQLLPVNHNNQTAYFQYFMLLKHSRAAIAFQHYEFCQGIDFMSYFINDAYPYVQIYRCIVWNSVAECHIASNRLLFWNIPIIHTHTHACINCTFKFIEVAAHSGLSEKCN